MFLQKPHFVRSQDGGSVGGVHDSHRGGTCVKIQAAVQSVGTGVMRAMGDKEFKTADDNFDPVAIQRSILRIGLRLGVGDRDQRYGFP
jgi:hypothetical protein